MASSAVSAGPVIAGGNVGNINSNNTINIYHRDCNPRERRKELANWVSEHSFSQYQSKAYERYTEGTLLWVLGEPEFLAWLRDGGMLWCPGKPGAGKTVFASFIIHHLQNHLNAVVCYVYHQYDTIRSTRQIFEAILKQLILRCPSLNIDRVEAARNQDQRLTLMEILSILRETFAHFLNIFIVLDAFDECSDEPTRHQVLHYLQSFHSVNTLITSRHLPSIEGAVSTARRLIISAHDEDIKTHFREQKDVNPTLAKLVSRVSDTDVEGKVAENADGSFLLAGLYIMNLAMQTDVSRFRHALKTLPQEVTASYEGTLGRIRAQDPNRRRLAFHTLSWIFYALRPLSLIELRHALATHDLDRMADEDDLIDEEIIISSCAGLVVVNRSEDHRGEEIIKVNFLHHTVQEFLQQARQCGDFLSEVEIISHCMKVVSFPDITSNPPNYPLISYAASAWGPLVHRHEQDKMVFKRALSQLNDLVAVGILSDAQIDYDLRSYCGDYRGQSGATAIHLVAVYGLLGTMKELLGQPNVDVNSKDKSGRTPLSWVAENGNLEVIKELLAHPNVDVNSKDQFGRTPLSWAAENGHLEVVKLLVDRPLVDINLRDTTPLCLTPLLWAAKNTHYRVVEVLLKAGWIERPRQPKLSSAPPAQLRDPVLVNQVCDQSAIQLDDLKSIYISNQSHYPDSKSPKLRQAAVPVEHPLQWLQKPNLACNDQRRLLLCSHRFTILTSLQTQSLRLLFWLD